jgi:hypothetical protein
MRIGTLFLSLVLAAGAAAQARNVAYLELGGSGIIPTFNYERQLSERLFGRVGFSFVTSEQSDGEDDLTFVFPVAVNYLTHPAGNHHFEAGAGLTWITGDEQDLWEDDDDEQISNLVGTANFGYRYQKPGRGFVFRAGMVPILHDGELAPWAGLSLGYRW